jgi:hypothetical protein
MNPALASVVTLGYLMVPFELVKSSTVWTSLATIWTSLWEFRLTSEGNKQQAVFQIKQIPRAYIEHASSAADSKPSPWNPERTNLAFSRFLNMLLHADVRAS